MRAHGQGPARIGGDSPILTQTDIDRARWDAYVAGTPSSAFYHQYDWLQLVGDVYGGEPIYLAAQDDGELAGVLPLMLRKVVGAGRVLLSVPFADEGGMLAESDEARAALIDAARTLMDERSATYVEMRQREPIDGSEVDRSRVNMEMVLPEDADTLWDDFKGKVRNQVRKAGKSGLEAAPAADVHAAIERAFYPVYCENTRDLGSPMHSERFFHEMADRFPGACDIVTVYEGDSVAGAGFALRWRGRMSVPWASSLRRYFDMCPNNLLYWELMRLAFERGCSVFDFGRSPKESGTYRFKKQWGAEPVQLHYCYLGNAEIGDRRDSRSYRIFSSVWERTPLPIARALGPKIFARLPI